MTPSSSVNLTRPRPTAPCQQPLRQPSIQHYGVSSSKDKPHWHGIVTLLSMLTSISYAVYKLISANSTSRPLRQTWSEAFTASEQWSRMQTVDALSFFSLLSSVRILSSSERAAEVERTSVGALWLHAADKLHRGIWFSDTSGGNLATETEH